MRKKCSYRTCDRVKRKSGLCDRHFAQHEAGLPLTHIERAKRKTIAERIDGLTYRDGECLRWSGWVGTRGYGFIKVGGKYVSAHRTAFEQVHGPIPGGKQLDHTCRNRDCVEVSHLRQVTNKQNQENTGLRSDNTTGYRGVKREFNRFSVSVQHHGKRHFKFGFATAEEAAEYGRRLRNRLFTHNDDDRKVG